MKKEKYKLILVSFMILIFCTVLLFLSTKMIILTKNGEAFCDFAGASCVFGIGFNKVDFEVKYFLWIESLAFIMAVISIASIVFELFKNEKDNIIHKKFIYLSSITTIICGLCIFLSYPFFNMESNYYEFYHKEYGYSYNLGVGSIVSAILFILIGIGLFALPFFIGRKTEEGDELNENDN